MIDFGRKAADGADDLVVGNIEVVRSAHIDDERHRCGADILLEVYRRDLAANSVHALSPREFEF
jgi:hypothetical protein